MIDFIIAKQLVLEGKKKNLFLSLAETLMS